MDGRKNKFVSFLKKKFKISAYLILQQMFIQ